MRVVRHNDETVHIMHEPVVLRNTHSVIEVGESLSLSGTGSNARFVVIDARDDSVVEDVELNGDDGVSVQFTPPGPGTYYAGLMHASGYNTVTTERVTLDVLPEASAAPSYTCLTREGQLASFTSLAVSVSFVDAVNLLYASLGRLPQSELTNRIAACGDFDSDGSLSFTDFVNVLYVSLGRLPPHLRQCERRLRAPVDEPFLGAQIGYPFFTQTLGDDRAILLDLPRVARANSFQHLEFYIHYPAADGPDTRDSTSTYRSLLTDPTQSLVDAFAPLRAELQAHNVTVTGFLVDRIPDGSGTSIGAPGTGAAHAQFIDLHAAAWKSLGVQYARFNYDPQMGSVDELRLAVAAGARAHIRVVIENHASFTRATEMLALQQTIDSPYFGLLLDTANFRPTAEDTTSDSLQTMMVAPHASTLCLKTLNRVGDPLRLNDDQSILDLRQLLPAFWSSDRLLEPRPMIEYEGPTEWSTLSDAMGVLGQTRDAMLRRSCLQI